MFFSGLFQRKSDAPVTTPAELADAIGLSYDTYTGKQISSQRAMRLTAVFSCVRVLAESVGMLPCNLYHLNGSLKQRATGERLHKLISTHPNGYMTPQEFWELVVTCLCLRGNFYAYKVKAFGEVAELLPVDPGCVVPKLNSSWEPVYQVTFPDGSTDVLSQEDIWHVRTLTLDGLVGLNPIAYAREAISLAAATEEHGARLFSNGAVTSGVLRTEQTLSDQAYERLKKDFEERHTGLGNAHRPMILEMGLDWKSMALNAEDSQFLETRKFQLEEICRLFRVPLHMVQNRPAQQRGLLPQRRHPKRTRKRRKPTQNPQKRLPHRPPVRRRHRHHRRLLQKMRRPDRRQQRGAAPRRHPRRRQRLLAVRQRQHRAKVRQNPQQRALRQRQNGQRILHPPWRLRMRARRKRG